MSEAAVGLRLDKWLWQARFAKSRSLAGTWAAEGRIRIDGEIVRKPHFTVRPDMVLTFAQGPHIRVVKVLALGTRRGPAAEAAALYDDLAPPTKANRLPRDLTPGPQVPTRPAGTGRPTKRDRRAIDRLREGE